MCLLRKAAEAWEKLLNLRYDMVFGRKKKKQTPALFGSRIEPDCAYCAFHADGVQKKCLAGQLGGEHCAKFQYDPLRREPKSEQKLGQYSAEEFKL